MRPLVSENGILAGWEPRSHPEPPSSLCQQGWCFVPGGEAQALLHPWPQSAQGAVTASTIYPAPRAVSRVPTPLSSSSGMCTQRALTSAGRSFACLQGDRCSHPWGQPQTLGSIPEAQPRPLHTLCGVSWGTPAISTLSPCPLHLLPMLLSPREAGKSAGIERIAAPARKSHTTEQQGQQHECLNEAPIDLGSKRSFPFCCPYNAKGRWVQGTFLVKN